MTVPQQSDWSLDSPSTQTISSGGKLVRTSFWSVGETGGKRKIGSSTMNRNGRFFFQCFLVGALLAGIALAVVLSLWLTSPTTSTRTTFSTVSTTEPTTSETSTTATTSTTTTSISTSSTSSATSTTTSITTTTTTPLPPCPPASVNSSAILYSNGSSSTAYRCNSFAWQAPSTTSVSLTFQMRHDPDYWYLDDVSVLQGSTEMINDGGFESGSFSSWATSAPNGCGSGFRAEVWTSFPHNGGYAVRDGCNGRIDRISQSFSAVAGQIYVIRFWMKSNHTGSSVIANVTLF